ncbi:MAG: hypothetical protein ABMA02_19550, partial [Saprospiraceae bacterium]
TRSPAHPLTRSLSHPLTRSPAHPLTLSPAHPLTPLIVQRIASFLLCFVFLVSLTLKSGHALLLNHIHHAVPTCETGHDAAGAHLHDGRYNPDDCSICAFLFAVPELVSISVVIKKPQPVTGDSPVAPAFPHFDCAHHLVHLRGPPTARCEDC